jgi:hypothetical protein
VGIGARLIQFAAPAQVWNWQILCKSLFALVIKISFGCARDFRVNMWGTSLPDDKLAGDLGNVIGATSIGGRQSDFFYSKKIGAGQFGTFATISALKSQAGPLLDGLLTGVLRTMTQGR